MPSRGGTLLFVITSTPSIEAELLGSKLLAVNNGVAVDVSNSYDSRIGGTANTKLSRNLHHKDCVGYLHHKKDCVGYLVKATANVTIAPSHTSNKVLLNSWRDRPFTHLMPSGGGTLLFVITSTPSIKAELLGAKLLAVKNVLTNEFSNSYNNLQHKKDCVGYLVKATANETSTGALSGSPWSVFGRHIEPALNVKGGRDTRGQLGGPTDTTLCITHTSVVQDTCS